MPQSLISVVVPIFNGERHLEPCLTSLLGQSHAAMEVIAVNDGSTDRTRTILDELGKRDPRLTVVHCERNIGVHRARHRGVAAARGELVGFADADDWASPRMYETLAAALSSHKADIAICNAANIAPDGSQQGLRGRLKISGTVEDNLLQQFCSLQLGSGVLWNKLYRRPLIDLAFSHPLTEVLPAGEDYLINLAAFAKTERATLVQEPLYNCRCDPDSVSRSGTNARGFARTLRAYVVALESFPELGESGASLIDELFLRQLRYPSYFLQDSAELAPHAALLRESLERLAAVRPQAVYTLLHTFELWPQPMTPAQEFKQAIRSALRATRKIIIGG